MNKLKKIGQGLQHNVYDAGNGRVIKRPMTSRERVALLKKWSGKKSWTPVMLRRFTRGVERTHRQTQDTIQAMSKLASRIDVGFLGKPEFIKDAIYSQDRLVVLGEYMQKHSLVQNKRILRKYRDSIILGWRYGFGETVFNFAVNSGIDKKENVVFMDLGEFTFDKNWVKRLIRSKRWLKSQSYMELKDQKLKFYYKSLMEKGLTIMELEKNWRTSL